MKVSRLLFLCLGLFMLQSAVANTIYMEYDPSCMDRYEYRYKGVNAGFSHIVYHLRLNDKEKVILEVGIESKIDYETKPNNVKRCRDVSINERMVRDINSGDLQVYIVKKAGNGFNVSPVGISSYAQISNKGIGYSAVDNIFAYNYAQPANGANLAKKGSEAKVFYNGTLSHSCPKKYLFTKTKSKAGKNYSEITLIPGIGVIQEKTGFNQTDAESNVLELVSINGVTLQSYLNSFCAANNNNLATSFYSSRKGSIDRPIMTTNPQNTDPVVTTTPTTTTTTSPGTTVVTTSPGGCTIYKDLDVGLYMDRSTGQPANTSCGGNTYRNGYMVGDQVVTTSPGTVVTTTPVVIETTPNTNVVEVEPGPGTYIYCKEVSTYGTHIVQPNETLYGIARQYGLTVNQLKSYNSIRGSVISPCQKLYTQASGGSIANNNDILVAKDGSNYVHVVQRGETLYQLASQYGFTVAKFKAINGLSSNVINVGQKLRISECNCPANTTATPTSAEVVTVTRDVPTTYGATSSSRIVANGPQKRQVHIVKEDETIYSIAKAYSMSVDRLRSLNNLEINEIIIPYQRLYIN